ncbi:flippase [Psychromonas ossibalaenae]|uniref:flippase n=1 Tax=Psychromonas ossibalaenae TaxID=444922 RepID=UPI0003655BD9|nr:flippase [Psychromonas ossibalaenae]
MNIRNKLIGLSKHDGTMRYLKNTSWLLAEKVLRMSVGLVVTVWVTRYLGPENFGIFSYAQSFVGLFVVIATLGLDSIVVRELVNSKEKRDQILGTAFYLKLIGALLVLVSLCIAMQFTEHSNQLNIYIFIIAAGTVFQSVNVIDYYLQSEVLSKYVVYSHLITLLLSSVIKLALIYFEAPLVYFVFVVLFDSLVIAVNQVCFYFYLKLSPLKWGFNKATAISMLKESYPLILAGVINSIYMKIDLVMINSMLSAESVGYYSSAVKLSEVWFGVGVLICNSLFPAIVNAKQISEQLYYSRVYKLFRSLTFVAYILALIVWLLSEQIILGLYGEEFIDASPVLSVHILSAIFVYLGVSSGRWLISEGLTKFNLYRNLAALFVNIGLNIVFINKFGIIGAAYASLISYIVGFYLFDLCFKNTRYILLLKTKALLLIFPYTPSKSVNTRVKN